MSRYDVLHIKQLPDGTYDLANAEVEHLSAKKDTTVTAVVKDYRATHHINVNSTLSKLTDTAIQPYPGADGKACLHHPVGLLRSGLPYPDVRHHGRFPH